MTVRFCYRCRSNNANGSPHLSLHSFA